MLNKKKLIAQAIKQAIMSISFSACKPIHVTCRLRQMQMTIFDYQSASVSNIERMRLRDMGPQLKQEFFLCISGAIYGPLYQCKIPLFFPDLIKKIPDQKIYLSSFR